MSDIKFERVGMAGLITLGRPKALNALTEAMVRDMREALNDWARDDGVGRVVVQAEGKAFCAGGDIRDIYTRRSDAAGFFQAEYLNNAAVAAFPKPYIALMDGIVMGGGVGISVHGSHRVAGDNLVFAMPEAGIGLVPDVGTTRVLAALPHQFGRYLALTGATLGRDEATSMGLATHAVSSERLHDALDRAVHARALDDALDDLAADAEPLSEDLVAFVERVFDGDAVGAILDQAESDERYEHAGAVAARMREKSPTSLTLALELQKRHGEGTVEDALRAEYRAVSRILRGPDLYEGIRATVIDKDKAPRWSPPNLSAVDPDEIAAHFEVPEEGDLPLTKGATA
ncbi:MAG: enoyl-CoA hydratase/isomerase family protein [Pseudomonadota bacterium]